MTKAPTLMIAAGLAIAGAVAASVPAAAQDGRVPEITVRPFADGPGGTGYYGPYGRDLPGVYMLSNTRLPDTTPTITRGQVKLSSKLQIANEFSYNNPLPILDAWHGTLSGGWAF
jgi:hypothetical protein